MIATCQCGKLTGHESGRCRTCRNAARGRPCRHCGRSVISRPRGLCFRCYYTPEVKDLYPASKFAPRKETGFGFVLPEPTNHPPRSPEKIEVMAERFAAGVALFHPQDARA